MSWLPVLNPDLDALLRMGLAVLCGLAVGLNRAHHGNVPQPNRLRVHVLVGLSACLMVLAVDSDPQARSRVIQGVATGVGFLGAGEILVPNRQPKHHPPQVRGLTSAASIWFTAALGVTVAASTPVLAAMALLLALITLSNRSEANGNHGNGNSHTNSNSHGNGNSRANNQYPGESPSAEAGQHPKDRHPSDRSP